MTAQERIARTQRELERRIEWRKANPWIQNMEPKDFRLLDWPDQANRALLAVVKLVEVETDDVGETAWAWEFLSAIERELGLSP